MNEESKNAFEVYDEENDECYIYCNICDKYVIKRFYNNHLKSVTHINNSPSKKQRLFQNRENNKDIDDT